MSDLLTFFLFALGLALIAVGAYLVWPPVGLIVAGGELVAVTVAYSRPSR
jgi:hypothetical protein